MKFRINDPLECYLEESEYIDWRKPEVLAKAGELTVPGDSLASGEQAYHFVRDQIRHSWDAQDRRVTAKASEALREGVGICWAKANLLAALLRAMGIPAGICYQRLTLGDTPDTGYCIHALNAAYLNGRWVRLDARGNKPGIQAEFSLTGERLAFPVRKEMGEADYAGIFSRPHPDTMAVLAAHTDAMEMYLHHLPGNLEGINEEN